MKLPLFQLFYTLTLVGCVSCRLSLKLMYCVVVCCCINSWCYETAFHMKCLSHVSPLQYRVSDTCVLYIAVVYDHVNTREQFLQMYRGFLVLGFVLFFATFL